MELSSPVLTAHLFPELLESLLALLDDLTEEEWEAPTALPGWTVKDIAQHLLGGDLGNLSYRRDGYDPPVTAVGPEGVVAVINRLNAEWVQAGRRISPRLTRELLAFTGEQMNAIFASLDPYRIGGRVSWAGPEPAPVWLDIAREYTERWAHQAQIRDAVARPGIREPRLFHPVLDAFIRALPFTLRDIASPIGTVLQVDVLGDAGGTWSALREPVAWRLYAGSAPNPTATVSLDQEDAWRVWTKGMRPEEAEAKATVRGDLRLGRAVFSMVSILA